METKKKKNPRKSDQLFNIKYLAYHQSQLSDDQVPLDQFLRYCKFQLCVKNRVLLKDPVWDTYTKEEILIEYYAHMFESNEKFRQDFERVLGLEEIVVDGFADWADKMMKDDGDILPEELEESVKFSPDTIGDE